MSKYLEVSKKTIERDINKLSSMGIPIYTQNGYNGGVFIEPNYKFDKTFFTYNDIEDIVSAFYVLNCLNNNMYTNVIQKLCMLFPKEVSSVESDLTEYVKIELLEKPIKIEGEIFEIINNSFDEEKNIIITCSGKNYKISPLHYILRPDGICLDCLYMGNKKRFYIDEIEKCILTNEDYDRDSILKNLK